MTNYKRMLAAAAIVAGSTALYTAPAAAQATRTWVSGVGDDVNPCSRTAPCKTFAGAISKTASGGEINCLDPGGYGTLTVTKSITVDCTGTFGSTLNSGGINGFVINDSLTGTPGTIKVILRGLSINGAGTTPGLNGIRFISGSTLMIEDVLIQNQNGGFGISFQPSTNGHLSVHNVQILDTGNGAIGGGILVQPTGTGAARVAIDHVNLQTNCGAGVKVDTTGNTGSGVFVKITNSQLNGSNDGLHVQGSGALAVAALIGSEVFSNGGVGVNALSANARVEVSNSTITSNGTGVSASGGALITSFGDNRLRRNTVDGSFGAIAAKQ
jgi:hypothetical protein